MRWILCILVLGIPADIEAAICSPGYVSSLFGSYFSTFNFPNEYFTNSDQCWTFYNDGSSQITVVFRDFHTESNYDEVFIYDGSTLSSSSLWTFSGSLTDGYAVTSNGGYITVHFSSDSSTEYRGFQACACTYSYYLTYGHCGCDWNNDLPDDDYNIYESYNVLSAGAIAGIVVGVSVLILAPIIIGVSVACCCKGKGITQSNNTYASMRARGVYPGQNNNVRANHPDRKHNQVNPAPNTGPAVNQGKMVPPPYGSYPVATVSQNVPYGQYPPPSNMYPPPAVDAAYPPPPPSYVGPAAEAYTASNNAAP